MHFESQVVKSLQACIYFDPFAYPLQKLQSFSSMKSYSQNLSYKTKGRLPLHPFVILAEIEGQSADFFLREGVF